MDLKQFKHEYDLDRLQKITPAKQNFSMWVTPRFEERYGQGCYEELTANLVGVYAQKAELFIDVGAHYGYYTLLVGTVNPECKIIAFEPAPVNFEILRQNILLNNLPHATAYNQAISNINANAIFNISTASDHCALIEHPAVPLLRKIDVQLASLGETLLAHPGLKTLIKIDTEGHELQVLEGCEDILRANNNIQLFLEINPQCCKLAGIAPEAILQKLDDLGYECDYLDNTNQRIYRSNDSNTFKTEVETLIENNLSIHVLAKKKGLSTHALFFCHSSALAGSERSMLELVRELIGEYETMCTVILPSSGPLEDALKKAGAGIVIAPMNWWCTGAELPDDETIRTLYQQSFYWIYTNLELIRSINPDVIFTNSSVLPWGALTAALLRKPHIWRVSEFAGLASDLNFYLPFGEVLDLIQEGSDKVAPNSFAVQNALFPDPPEGKIQTIFTHIPMPAIDPNRKDAADDYFHLADACRVIISGTVMPSKGQEDAVRSVIELVKNRGRRVELVIVGAAQPGYQYHLQSIIRSADAEDYIHIHSFIPNVLQIVAAADIVLVCSTIEALSRVMIEGMLLKKTVVGTNTGGTAEIITDGETGLLYSPGDYVRLADQIEKLLDSPELLNRLGANAFAFASRKFTQACFGGEYYKVIREVVDRPYQEKPGIAGFMHFQKDLLIEKLLPELKQREASLEAFKLQMSALSAQVAERDVLLQGRDEQFKNHETLLQQRKQRLEALTAEVENLRGELNLTRAEMISYATSTSWRITRPLRKISALIRGRK